MERIDNEDDGRDIGRWGEYAEGELRDSECIQDIQGYIARLCTIMTRNVGKRRVKPRRIYDPSSSLSGMMVNKNDVADSGPKHRQFQAKATSFSRSTPAVTLVTAVIPAFVKACHARSSLFSVKQIAGLLQTSNYLSSARRTACSSCTMSNCSICLDALKEPVSTPCGKCLLRPPPERDAGLTNFDRSYSVSPFRSYILQSLPHKPHHSIYKFYLLRVSCMPVLLPHRYVLARSSTLTTPVKQPRQYHPMSSSYLRNTKTTCSQA